MSLIESITGNTEVMERTPMMMNEMKMHDNRLVQVKCNKSSG
jgi:hypothetical protein